MKLNDRTFNNVSGFLTKQWATNKNEHTLPRVKWMLPSGYNSALNVQTEVLKKESVWCSLNTGDIMVGVNAGFGQAWNNPEKRWYALSSYFCQKGAVLEHPKARTLADLSSLGEYGSTEFNLETLNNTTYTKMPPAVLLRMMLLFAVDGPIETGACIWVKCISTVSFLERSRGWLNHNKINLPSNITRPKPNQILEGPYFDWANPRQRFWFGTKLEYERPQATELPADHVIRRKCAAKPAVDKV